MATQQPLTPEAQNIVNAQLYLDAIKVPNQQKEEAEKNKAATSEAGMKVLSSIWSLASSPGRKSAMVRGMAVGMAMLSFLAATFKEVLGTQPPKDEKTTIKADNENGVNAQLPGIKTGTSGSFNNANAGRSAGASMSAENPDGTPVGSRPSKDPAPGSKTPGPATMEAA